jgi:hypothetical protein
MSDNERPTTHDETSREEVANGRILDGKSNVEVAYTLRRQFGLPERHARYPEIYRAKLVMAGLLTKEQARKTRGPSIPRHAEGIAALFRQFDAPDADLNAIIAGLPESRVGKRKKPRTVYTHRVWEEGTACGEDGALTTSNLGATTCPKCLLSFEGWVGPDSACPCCERHEWEGHADGCELVSGESPLADLMPFARGAQGIGASRPAYLAAYAKALRDEAVAEQARRAEQAMAQAQAEAEKLAALQQEVA